MFFNKIESIVKEQKTNKKECDLNIKTKFI